MKELFQMNWPGSLIFYIYMYVYICKSNKDHKSKQYGIAILRAASLEIMSSRFPIRTDTNPAVQPQF